MGNIILLVSSMYHGSGLFAIFLYIVSAAAYLTSALPLQFDCPGGGSIPESAVCDGKVDCGKSSGIMAAGYGYDEVHCCMDKFDSHNVSCLEGSCIKPSVICDGKVDCNNGLDEVCFGLLTLLGGGPLSSVFEKFTCPDGESISLSAFCDGKVDCKDPVHDSDKEGFCKNKRVKRAVDPFTLYTLKGDLLEAILE